MQEPVPALQFYAEQQIEKAGEGSRLAGLVRPVDDVQVGLAVNAFPEIDRLVGEPAVARKVQASQPHQPDSASAPSSALGLRRANTSSMPSRAASARLAANVSASAPSSDRH